MKRKILSTLGLMLGLGVLFSTVWVGIGHALNVRSGDAPTVGASETIDGTLYTAGKTVTISGTVKGDVFCAGEDVRITGTVEGDVICAAQTMRISGKVLGDVRAVGQKVDITADIAGSVTTAGNSVVVGEGARIGRDISVAGETFRLDGKVERDVLGTADTAVLQGAVARNAELDVNALTLGGGASVGGDLIYQSPTKALIDEGAKVAGKTDYHQREETSPPSPVVIAVWNALYGFGVMLLVGLAGIALAPRGFDAMAQVVRNRSIIAFAVGAGVLLGAPVTAVFLMLSLFGIPLGIIVLLSWIIALIAALPVAAYGIGWVVVEKLNWPPRGRRIASLAIGLLILTLIGLVPFVGGVIVFLALLVGLGAMVLAAGQRLFPSKAAVK